MVDARKIPFAELQRRFDALEYAAVEAQNDMPDIADPFGLGLASGFILAWGVMSGVDMQQLLADAEERRRHDA